MSRLFNSFVGYSGARGNTRVSTSFRCCLMDGGMDDPAGDTSVDSKLRKVTAVVKASDLGGIVPQVGDRVTTDDGGNYAVKSVQPFYGKEWIIEGRSC